MTANCLTDKITIIKPTRVGKGPKMDYSYLDRNVGDIRNMILKAAEAGGRGKEDITLMAAVKSADADEINYIHRMLGINDIGENRVQQLLDRWDKLDKEGLRVHFIGSLQTNKVKYIIDKVYLIHSLDSLHLASEIDKQAKKHDIRARVLIEINSGSEESKGGVSPYEASEFARSLSQFENIELCGFMTMAPKCEDKNDYYKYFGDTKTLCDKIWFEDLGREEPPILSMGMSESFCQAIESGSNMIRVGRSLFLKNS